MQRHVRFVYDQPNQNQRRAARLLGISLNSLPLSPRQAQNQSTFGPNVRQGGLILKLDIRFTGNSRFGDSRNKPLHKRLWLTINLATITAFSRALGDLAWILIADRCEGRLFHHLRANENENISQKKKSPEPKDTSNGFGNLSRIARIFRARRVVVLMAKRFLDDSISRSHRIA